MFESVGIQTLTTQFSFGENSETSCETIAVYFDETESLEVRRGG